MHIQQIQELCVCEGVFQIQEHSKSILIPRGETPKETSKYPILYYTNTKRSILLYFILVWSILHFIRRGLVVE